MKFCNMCEKFRMSYIQLIGRNLTEELGTFLEAKLVFWFEGGQNKEAINLIWLLLRFCAL